MLVGASPTQLVPATPSASKRCARFDRCSKSSESRSSRAIPPSSEKLGANSTPRKEELALRVGHDLGGERTAAILTLVATCVTHDVNPRAYLHLVTKLLLGGWPQKNLRDLLPDRLAVPHPEVLLRAHDVAALPALPD
jgi:hypothetical protein